MNISKNPLIEEFFKNLVEELTECSRQNYHAALEIDRRKDRMNILTDAITEMGGTLPGKYSPLHDPSKHQLIDE